MQQSQINQSEQLASLGRRIAAIVIDFLILGLVVVCEPILLHFSIVAFVFCLFYFWFLEWLFGQTLGKRLLGIRVVNASGKNISAGQSLGRTASRIIDNLFLGAIGAILIYTSSDRTRLGDRLASTHVVLGNSPIKAGFPFWGLVVVNLFGLWLLNAYETISSIWFGPLAFFGFIVLLFGGIILGTFVRSHMLSE